MHIPPIDPKHTLLAGNQVNEFNAFVARLSSEQTAWLLGYLTASQQLAPGEASKAATKPAAAAGAAQLTVLFASQTGNAAKVAKSVAAAANSAGIPAIATSTGDYKTTSLRNERNLILVASTQGEGDPPESAVELHRFLFSKRAPRLEELRFAVLALGDYSYANFCKAGVDFDQRLEELGAKRVLARVDCDV